MPAGHVRRCIDHLLHVDCGRLVATRESEREVKLMHATSINTAVVAGGNAGVLIVYMLCVVALAAVSFGPV